MRKKQERKVLKTIALSQIALLFLEVFAISFIFSLSFGGVSGAEEVSITRFSDAAGMQYIMETYSNGVQKVYEWNTIENMKGNYLYDVKKGAISNQYAQIANPSNLPNAGGHTNIASANVNSYGFDESYQVTYDSKGNINGYFQDGKSVSKDVFENGLKDVNPEGYQSYIQSITSSQNALPETLSKEIGWGPMTSNGLFLGNFLEGVGWAAMVGGGLAVISAMLPEKGKELFQPLAYSLAAGIIAGKTAYGASLKIGSLLGTDKDFDGWIRSGTSGCEWCTLKLGAKSIGLLAGGLTFYLILANNYQKTDTKEETIEFKCYSWQAPRGGADCTKCNDNTQQPCSEYRCKSLGQTCKLINQGTGQEKCIDGSRDDVTSPGIKPWDDALSGGVKYTNVKPRPPGGSTATSGMTIEGTQSTCIPAFTPFMFGIITTDEGDVNQIAQCKVDFNHTKSFNEMQYWLGDSNIYTENHSQAISLPGTSLTNSSLPSVENDGQYTLYIRCRDGNGNENRDEFAVKFCIDKSADLTAPVIKATSIPDNSPVSYKVDNVSVNVYTNEPAKCRWDRTDKDIKNMNNTMSCSNSVYQMNAEMLYTCKTTLTGVKDREENKFYIRCEDFNNNSMSNGYEYTLIGTQPLNVISTGPTGTIGGNTNAVTTQLNVKTDNGFRNGEATCLYSTQNESESGFINMFETGSNIHIQSLDLTNGDYDYFFKCVDAGGNVAYGSTNFTVFVDKIAPNVVRAYNLQGKLIAVTDENASCSYSTSSCNFDLSKNEGTAMLGDNEINHYAEWKTNQNYYIKCKDQYNNQPDSSVCSAVLKPYETGEPTY